MAVTFVEAQRIIEEQFNIKPAKPLTNFYFGDLRRFEITFVVQYTFDIIGVDRYNDPIRNFVERVRGEIDGFNLQDGINPMWQERVGNYNPVLKVLNFQFDEDENRALTGVLGELSDYYSANLDAASILAKARRDYKLSTRFQIIVVGILNPILVEKEHPEE